MAVTLRDLVVSGILVGIGIMIGYAWGPDIEKKLNELIAWLREV